ncbi:MAG: pimelyl-acyl-carrier protein methyl ester esterase [Rhodospirillaceae bacterium]|nr:MAG: pimelyl-acyl-carrier protein methyl ester esterase [Rhodospirillaceae bacterium]
MIPPSLEVVVVPGWGLGESVWAPVQAALTREAPDLVLTVLELGDVFADGTTGLPRLAVGHSTGFLWLLRRRPLAWRGLVAVNGFTRFVTGPGFPHGVDPRVLHRMLNRFEQDPAAVRTAFLERCGAPAVPFPPAAPLERLREGLSWLGAEDARDALAAEPTPVLVLAGGADPIVTPAMTEACFGGRGEIFWQPKGGHLLPFSHPAWTAGAIVRFARAIL